MLFKKNLSLKIISKIKISENHEKIQISQLFDSEWSYSCRGFFQDDVGIQQENDHGISHANRKREPINSRTDMQRNALTKRLKQIEQKRRKPLHPIRHYDNLKSNLWS